MQEGIDDYIVYNMNALYLCIGERDNMFYKRERKQRCMFSISTYYMREEWHPPTPKLGKTTYIDHRECIPQQLKKQSSMHSCVDMRVLI